MSDFLELFAHIVPLMTAFTLCVALHVHGVYDKDPKSAGAQFKAKCVEKN